MYYPIQIPYILNKEFCRNIEYKELVIENLSNFIICYWQMVPKRTSKTCVSNIIILDGCIDLIVDFGKEKIGFSGMSSTDFEFTIKLPTKFMGLRLVPNTFTMLTGRSASEAMDTFLLLSDVYSDFDTKRFFSLSFNLAKQYLINFIESKLGGHTPDIYTCLFNNFSTNIPKSVSEICQILNISQSQCQRVFLKHYGLTPKVVLSILRFQRALYLLVSTRKKSNYIMDHVSYYDQPHFIKDFKKNIGLTPIELLKKFDK